MTGQVACLALLVLVTVPVEALACLRKETKAEPVSDFYHDRMEAISATAPFAAELNKKTSRKAINCHLERIIGSREQSA